MFRHALHMIVEPSTGAPQSVVPSLPSTYAADDPSQIPNAYVTGGAVHYVDYDNLDGYADARSHGPDLAGIEFTFPSVEHRARLSYGSSPSF